MAKAKAKLAPAEWDLVIRNRGLVHSVVGVLTPRLRIRRDEFDGAIQAGLIGLSRAVANHDPAKGKLSTIAQSHIKVHVKRWLRRERSRVHVPEYVAKEPGCKHGPAAELVTRASFHSLDEWRTPGAEAPDPVEAEDEAAAVRRAVEMLPGDERRVIELRMAGLPLWGVAEEMGLGRERVRRIERDARDKLRDWLAKLAS